MLTIGEHSPAAVANATSCCLSSGRSGLRILLPVLNFGAEETGVGHYTYEMARFFAQAGHEVTVICAPPYYPWWKVQEPHRSWKYARESIDGMNVIRCPIYVPSRPSGVKRLLHLASLSTSSLFPALFQSRNFDLVWLAQPSLSMSPIAMMASLLSKARTWMHVQDLEVAAANRLKVLPEFVTDAIGSMESLLYEQCSAISTISHGMRKQLETRCLHDIPIFPNWVDLDFIRPMQDASPYRAELGIPDGITVALYSGNMGEKQGLDIVIEAAKVLQERTDLLFVLAGQGAIRSRLEESAKGLANVRFLPLQPAERMSEFLALGDIHLVPQKAGVGDLVMPSKMTGILSAARPVIATCDLEDELAVTVKECGLAVRPGDSAAFAKAIVEMLESPEARKALGMAGRIYAEKNLSHKAILPRMEAYLWKIAGVTCPST
ncbi:MAG: hypothetical protein RL318_2925 [Fibrobacterota bacterium]|jgi:colanic acid biosynthesis glycosyl transferase WcaI